MQHVRALTHTQWILLHSLWFAQCSLWVLCVFVYVWAQVHYWCKLDSQKWRRSKSVMREHSGHCYIIQRERDTGKERRIKHLFSFSWTPHLHVSSNLFASCLLIYPSFSPSTHLPHPGIIPGIASWGLNSKLTDCRESWRIEEDMRGGEEESGGPEFPWRLHRTPACGTNWCVCAHICVFPCGDSRLAQWGDTIRFFFSFSFN